MTTSKTKAETILDGVRRALAKAVAADTVLSAGRAIPDLIVEIETARDTLDDEIAAEAESIDRSRANHLRSQRVELGDLLTDAEYLERRIEEKHKTMLKGETEAAMNAKRAAALKKQSEAKAILIKIADPLQTVVSGIMEYQRMASEIDALNHQLRAADHHELCVRPPLHDVTNSDENLPAAFEFLQSGRLMMPGVSGPNLLEIAARLKNKNFGK